MTENDPRETVLRLDAFAMAVVLLIAALIGVGVYFVVQKPPAIAANPIDYDWGNRCGASLSHEFTIENGGDRDLVIRGIDCSSERMVAKVRRVIRAGERVPLRVDVNSLDWHGRLEGTVELFSNDPLRPVTRLTLGGAIVPYVEKREGRAELEAPVGEIARATLHLTPNEAGGVRIERATARRRLVAAELEPDPAGGVLLHLEGKITEGLRSEVIDLSLASNAGGAMEEIIVFLREARPFVLSPAHLAFTAGRDTDRSQLVTVRFPASPATRMREFRIAGGDGIYECAQTAAEGGAACSIEVRMRALPAQAYHRATLEIITDDEDLAAIEVPIYFRRRGEARD